MLDGGKVIVDKSIADRSTEDRIWTLADTTSGDLVQRLTRRALAVAKMGCDDETWRLGVAI